MSLDKIEARDAAADPAAITEGVLVELEGLHERGTIGQFEAAMTARLPALISAIRAQRAALARLGSMEAFTVSRCVDATRDAELMARIEFALSSLASKEPSNGR
jgi:hypothetical protein